MDSFIVRGPCLAYVTLLALFDASSAFDMVEYEILFQRLETSLDSLAPSPLVSLVYLSDRSKMLVLGATRSSWVPVLNKFFVSFIALFLAISSASFSYMTLLFYLLNTLPLATFTLTMYRLMSNCQWSSF